LQVTGVNGVYGAGSSELGLTQNAFYNASSQWIYGTTNAAGAYQISTGVHKWLNAASGTAGNPISFTQAMTLDAAGCLNLGQTSSALQGAGTGITIYASSAAEIKFLNSSTGSANTDGTALVNGGLDFTINNREAGNVIFGTSNAERARIDSSGNLLVGVTSTYASAKMSMGFVGSASNGFVINNTNSSGSPVHIAFQLSGTSVGSITCSGSATAFNTSSDQRLKENIVDADSASSLIDSLQVRQFDWKANGSHQRYGFIAQELVTVAPEAVYQPTDTDEMMAVDYSKLVPMLVKEIQSLRQRLSAANL
jgi:hypothetical protein